MPDGYSWSNVSLAILVKGAYGIRMDNQVIGMPNWANDEYYDISAKTDAETAERWKTLPRKERGAEEQRMERALLADRCNLKAHQETRDLPVYELVIAKGGLKMKEAPSGEPMSERMTLGQIVAHARTVDAIANEFPNIAGRLIIDKTGLEGKKFDYELKWNEDDRHTADDSGPSFFTALEEQLGLKLVPAKAPVNILIIDHIDHPSPN